MSPDPLQSAGLRRTPARKAVWAHLVAEGRPASHAALSAALPTLDDITLYRTLAAFTAAGLTHRVCGTDGVWRYAIARSPGCPGNHAHFLCEDCGAMVCLIEQAMPRIAAPPGATIHSRQLLATGRCAACCPP